MRPTCFGTFALLAGALMLTSISRAGERRPTDDNTKKESGAAKRVIEGEFTEDDPFDKLLKKSHAKTYPLTFVKGQTYKIDMVNRGKIDPLLRLENAKGEELAEDDDGGGAPNARLIFKAPADGEYRLIATTYPPGKTGEATGKFSLTIQPINWKEYLAGKVKPLAAKGADIGPRDAQGAIQTAMGLEGASPELAADAYAAFGKVLAKASEEKIADLGKMMQGAARRMTLLGAPITMHGQTLEGKEFAWKKYRGKIVLVDFWATWCGPCIAEIPNVKKLYKTYHRQGFDVVAISLDDDKDSPIEFMQARKLPWVCLFDKEPGKGLEPLAQYYGVFSIPRAILVDRDGRVISMNARGEELDRLLEKHLGGSEKPEQREK